MRHTITRVGLEVIILYGAPPQIVMELSLYHGQDTLWSLDVVSVGSVGNHKSCSSNIQMPICNDNVFRESW